MSYRVGYTLASTPSTQTMRTSFQRDRVAPVMSMNRIAQLACERFLVLMNETLLIKEHRLSNMSQVLKYLNGMHEDVGMSGDRGDFYRRKLAEQIYLKFGISGVNHTNVIVLVESAISLERASRQLMSEGGLTRDAPPIDIDETVLDILARLADMF
ncbi:Hypothetical predicted protein [Mytilus galloprovincialis]|uniref:Uncharacterized protein n=1 Tax=Mytilus galloprovincialis TaxID=29158 RepID=A0A8B6FYZ5_MYTGA|nr:Hypothetical predicted protein [Mytilus galloprovincialis]